jgi:hypothetical protein
MNLERLCDFLVDQFRLFNSFPRIDFGFLDIFPINYPGLKIIHKNCEINKEIRQNEDIFRKENGEGARRTVLVNWQNMNCFPSNLLTTFMCEMIFVKVFFKHFLCCFKNKTSVRLF